MNNITYSIKENVSLVEYDTHCRADWAFNAVSADRPLVAGNYNINKRQMQVEKPPPGCMTVSEMYGDAFESVPSQVVEQIRALVRGLALAGVSYAAITGRTFIVNPETGAVFASDFRDATVITDAKYASLGNFDATSRLDPFVMAFSSGQENRWNPRFTIPDSGSE